MNPRPLELEINGVPFKAENIEINTDHDIEYLPKEYELIHSPDKYGGVTMPVPVDPHDTEPVVTNVSRTGSIRSPVGFPSEEVRGADGEVLTVDINATLPEQEWEITGVRFNPWTLHDDLDRRDFEFESVERK